MNSATHTILGYCPGNLQTAKAVRVTVLDVNGESIGSADTVWLPRSIAENLTVTEELDPTDSWGATWLVVRATVPAWWVRKLDNRPAWVREGRSCAPSPVRI